MISDATPTFSINKELPAVEKKPAGRIVITLTLSVEEILYLTWQNEAIKSSLSEKVSHIFLGASDKMQQSFNLAIRNYTTVPPQLSTLVDSIAAKTATYVMNTLEITKKTTEINDEKEQKKNAAQLQQNIIKQGLKGAMITAREAQVIVTFIRNYQANIKSTGY